MRPRYLPQPDSRQPVTDEMLAYFWSRVKRSEDLLGCWEWTGETNIQGYGQMADRMLPKVVDTRRPGRPTTRYHRRPAHRIAYELLVGPIPDGLTLDHLCHTNDRTCAGNECRHRRCVNPAHLEPVTDRENNLRGNGIPARNARKTHCKRGHSLANAHIDPHGQRICRPCSRAKWRAWYWTVGRERRRAAA